MPYITEDKRRKMDRVVEQMLWVGVKADGDLNYILYKYCKENIPVSYNSFKNFCGELRQCATEIERRLLAPYEEKQIVKNGDV